MIHLSTACTVVNRRGEFFTRLVKTNSKRDWLYLEEMHSACVLPLSRDLAFRMEMFRTVLNPIPRNRNAVEKIMSSTTTAPCCPQPYLGQQL